MQYFVVTLELEMCRSFTGWMDDSRTFFNYHRVKITINANRVIVVDDEWGFWWQIMCVLMEGRHRHCLPLDGFSMKFASVINLWIHFFLTGSNCFLFIAVKMALHRQIAWGTGWFEPHFDDSLCFPASWPMARLNQLWR